MQVDRGRTLYIDIYIYIYIQMFGSKKERTYRRLAALSLIPE